MENPLKYVSMLIQFYNLNKYVSMNIQCTKTLFNDNVMLMWRDVKL